MRILSETLQSRLWRVIHPIRRRTSNHCDDQWFYRRACNKIVSFAFGLETFMRLLVVSILPIPLKQSLQPLLQLLLRQWARFTLLIQVLSQARSPGLWWFYTNSVSDEKRSTSSASSSALPIHSLPLVTSSECVEVVPCPMFFSNVVTALSTPFSTSLELSTSWLASRKMHLPRRRPTLGRLWRLAKHHPWK